MLRRDWLISFALAAVLSLTPQLLVTWFVLPALLPYAHGSWLIGFVIGWAIAGLLVTPPACLLVALLTLRFSTGALSEPTAWTDCLLVGVRRSPVLYLTTLGSDLAISAGLLLLIVPGVLLSLAWAVLGPVVVLEGRSPLTCFGRSAELTRGEMKKVLTFWLIYIVIAFVLGLLLGFVQGMVNGLVHLPPQGISWATPLASAVTLTVTSAARTSLYRELKILKEGDEPDLAASVFS